MLLLLLARVEKGGIRVVRVPHEEEIAELRTQIRVNGGVESRWRRSFLFFLSTATRFVTQP